MNPLARTTYHGRAVDEATKAAVKEAEAMLGYELTIVQGSFNTSVSASAGTHAKGRVIDLAPFDWKRKIKVLRTVGFAAWHRTALPGVWGEHIHCVLILDSFFNRDGIASSAYAQITDYVNDRDGLAQHRPDPDWRPSPLRLFTYPPKEIPVNPVANDITRARDKFVEAAHLMSEGIVLLQKHPDRKAAFGRIPAARAVRRSIHGILHILPPR